jgi:hypothetical protein
MAVAVQLGDVELVRLPATEAQLRAAELRALLQIARTSLDELGTISPDLWAHVDRATDAMIDAMPEDRRRP